MVSTKQWSNQYLVRTKGCNHSFCNFISEEEVEYAQIEDAAFSEDVDNNTLCEHNDPDYEPPTSTLNTLEDSPLTEENNRKKRLLQKMR